MPAPTLVPAVARLEGDSLHEARKHRRASQAENCTCGESVWTPEHVVTAVHKNVVTPAVEALVTLRREELAAAGL